MKYGYARVSTDGQSIDGSCDEHSELKFVVVPVKAKKQIAVPGLRQSAIPHLLGEALEMAVRIGPLADHDPMFGSCDQQFLKVIVDVSIAMTPLTFKN
jgi:hypothetical protein